MMICYLYKALYPSSNIVCMLRYELCYDSEYYELSFNDQEMGYHGVSKKEINNYLKTLVSGVQVGIVGEEMRRSTTHCFLGLLLTAALVTACGGGGGPDPVPLPPAGTVAIA